jgi:hypothetical protein
MILEVRLVTGTAPLVHDSTSVSQAGHESTGSSVVNRAFEPLFDIQDCISKQ